MGEAARALGVGQGPKRRPAASAIDTAAAPITPAQASTRSVVSIQR